MGTRIGLLIATVALAGCAPSEMSIFVGNAVQLDETCSSTGDAQLLQGTLDIFGNAISATPSYRAQFGVQSELEDIETRVGDDLLASGHRNDFIADTIITSYTATGSGASLPQAQSSSIYFVVPPGSDTAITFNMISTQAANVIGGMIPPGGAPLDVLITFQFTGRLRSQPNSALTRLSSNQATFPLRVQNTAPAACNPPMVRTVVGPCGNTQDIFTVTCQ